MVAVAGVEVSVRARVRTSCLNERLRHSRRRARGVEHLNLLRDGGLRVPGADAARLGHLLRQRERARHLGHGVAGEKRETDLGERVGRLLEDGLVDGLLDPGHDVVLVHVLSDLIRRRHGVRVAVCGRSAWPQSAVRQLRRPLDSDRIGHQNAATLVHARICRRDDEDARRSTGPPAWYMVVRGHGQ